MQLDGLHHITAVTAEINSNVNFYTQVLGLRLVKKSVNQDDVSAYHLFYADQVGSPGTDITFFDWSHIGPALPGTESIQGTTFRVSSREALLFWRDRLESSPAKNVRLVKEGELQLLSFQDPEGQQLYLANDQGAEFNGELWPRPDIPEKYLLRGFYSAVLTTPQLKQMDEVFTSTLNFEFIEKGTWIDGLTSFNRYQTKNRGGPGTEVWVLHQPDQPPARLGAGGVHHVAFRVKNTESQERWRSHLEQEGIHSTQIIDRFWFKSIYFRVSPGILFEIATEGPGFTVDEKLDSLGEILVLPPFLESRREEIENNLKPIKD